MACSHDVFQHSSTAGILPESTCNIPCLLIRKKQISNKTISLIAIWSACVRSWDFLSQMIYLCTNFVCDTYYFMWSWKIVMRKRWESFTWIIAVIVIIAFCHCMWFRHCMWFCHCVWFCHCMWWILTCMSLLIIWQTLKDCCLQPVYFPCKEPKCSADILAFALGWIVFLNQRFGLSVDSTVVQCNEIKNRQVWLKQVWPLKRCSYWKIINN